MREFFSGDTNLYGYGMENQEDLPMPEKLKQMGSVESQIRIFVEDYVYTYLYQYGRCNGGKEKVAASVGKHIQMNGQEAIIVCGAIQGKHAVLKNGVQCFSDETWEYIGNQMELYFKGMEVVGWVHLQPGFGSFLMTRDETFHREFFKERWQVLFVVDTQDKQDTFYIYSEEKYTLRQARGYYIYYDKNKEMQDYMLDNLVVKSKVEQTDEDKTEIFPTQKMEDGNNEEGKTIKAMKKSRPTDRIDAAADIRRVLQKRAKEAEEAQKGHYVMLAGVSCMLCVTCLCMAFALMSSMNRLKSLEGDIISVQNSYVQLEESVEGVKVQAAFAADVPTVSIEDATEVVKPFGQEKKWYTVESGDTLGYISRKYYGDNSGMQSIMQANNIDNADMIYEGQVLVIP